MRPGPLFGGSQCFQRLRGAQRTFDPSLERVARARKQLGANLWARLTGLTVQRRSDCVHELFGDTHHTNEDSPRNERMATWLPSQVTNPRPSAYGRRTRSFA